MTTRENTRASVPQADAPQGQPAREANIQAICAHFANGATSKQGDVGIELEFTLVHAGSLKPVSYYDEGGARWVLEHLREQFPTVSLAKEGDIIGVAAPGRAVTLEPAGQVELSAGPFSSLAQALECFQDFEQALGALLRPLGIRAMAIGYHPSAKALDLQLIPKDRYAFMNRYLGGIGPYGPCMMRGSGSTQVSIDYRNEADCVAKMRLAQLLTPVFSLISDNAPVFEGRPRSHQLVRTKIWRECDKDRCGCVPGLLDGGFSWRDYACYILDTPAIVAPDDAGGVRFDTRSFGQIYATREMGATDVEHALSMVFPDVRLKSYVEIRPADCMPVPFAIAYAALVKGLLANDAGISRTQELLEGLGLADAEAAKTAMMAQGYDARIYGRTVGQLADALFDIARSCLPGDERELLGPLAELAAQRRTLAQTPPAAH